MSVISETRMIMKVKGLSGGTWGSKRSQFAPGWLMYAWSVFGNKHLLDWRPDVSPLIFLYSNRERILESESELIINIRKAVSHYTVYINPDADSKDAQCGFIYIYIYIYIYICVFISVCFVICVAWRGLQTLFCYPALCCIMTNCLVIVEKP